ncbi:hypothetical protein KIAC18_003965 [Sporomusa sphaeroides]|uniref:hypothetical protein n=1 Tax=Sporomusa sphaeroides TaxID=47679 RepID=UPI003DA04C7C
MSKGVELIAVERLRQTTEEEWTAEHDRQHTGEDLAMAAACYAMPEALRSACDFIHRFWPWEMRWWKPKPDSRVRELVKAGALIAAEIDRLIAKENRT